MVMKRDNVVSLIIYIVLKINLKTTNQKANNTFMLIFLNNRRINRDFKVHVKTDSGFAKILSNNFLSINSKI